MQALMSAPGGSSPPSVPSRAETSIGDRRARRRRTVWAILTVAVVLVVVVVLAIRWYPSGPGGTHLPGVLSVIPEPSDTALRSAWALSNNTTGGPWTPQIGEGWDNTEGLSQVPSVAAGALPCPLQGAAISNYGVLPYDGSYSTGLAEGWLWSFVSGYDGGSNQFVWVGDGTAYEVGQLITPHCAVIGPVNQSGPDDSSTGAAIAGTLAKNYTRFTETYPAGNASYTLDWIPLSGGPKAAPLWTIAFNACNGTIPEAAVTEVWGSNGTIASSSYGEGAGAHCGSALVDGPPDRATAGPPDPSVLAARRD